MVLSSLCPGSRLVRFRGGVLTAGWVIQLRNLRLAFGEGMARLCADGCCQRLRWRHGSRVANAWSWPRIPRISRISRLDVKRRGSEGGDIYVVYLLDQLDTADGVEWCLETLALAIVRDCAKMSFPLSHSTRKTQPKGQLVRFIYPLLKPDNCCKSCCFVSCESIDQGAIQPKSTGIWRKAYLQISILKPAIRRWNSRNLRWLESGANDRTSPNSWSLFFMCCVGGSTNIDSDVSTKWCMLVRISQVVKVTKFEKPQTCGSNLSSGAGWALGLRRVVNDAVCICLRFIIRRCI